MADNDNIIQLEYNVEEGDLLHAGEASSKIKMTLMEVGMPQELIRRVAIATYEGEINMVIHANGGVAKVWISSDDVKVVLRDTGKGIPDIEQAMVAGFSTASPDTVEMGFGAGMGLPNMKKHSDEMEIESEVGVGTTVTMRFVVKQ